MCGHLMIYRHLSFIEKRSIVIEICVKGIFKKCYFGECVTIPVEHQGTFSDKASHR